MGGLRHPFVPVLRPPVGAPPGLQTPTRGGGAGGGGHAHVVVVDGRGREGERLSPFAVGVLL